MPRDFAVQFLLNDCIFDPPINEAQAEALWQPYRDRVEALPARPQGVPGNLGLTLSETNHTTKFRRFLASGGPNDLIGFRKVDLRELTVCQYYVATDLSNGYANRAASPQDWLAMFLPLAPRSVVMPPGRMRAEKFDRYIEWDLPHSEFFFGNDNQGKFAPTQLMHHVTGMIGTDRMFLWAGYHRSFARVSTTPTAAVPTAVIAVVRNSMVAPALPNTAPAEANGVDPLGPFGPLGDRAAKFGDFFTAGLYMDVDLRKKRYQLQVQAKWVALDDPS